MKFKKSDILNRIDMRVQYDISVREAEILAAEERNDIAKAEWREGDSAKLDALITGLTELRNTRGRRKLVTQTEINELTGKIGLRHRYGGLDIGPLGHEVRAVPEPLTPETHDLAPTRALIELIQGDTVTDRDLSQLDLNLRYLNRMG